MITTITLNASIDKAYSMDREIENGTVMRVASIHNSAGGKGLNVARVIRLCKEDVLASGLVGGYNGKYLEALLDQDGIRHDFDHIEGETRSCINILDKTFGSTEYLEPGCEVSKAEEEKFLSRFPGIIKDSSVVTISGSVPRGMSKDIYQKMTAMAKDAGKQVILDTSGELLKKGMQACPAVVKPNKDEMEMLFQVKIRGMEDVIVHAEKIAEKGIGYVVVSLGGDGALMVCKDGIFHGKPPKVTVVNTVGCGDSMVGALAVALHRKYDAKKALQFAVAVATANAMTANTGDFEPEVCEKLVGGVKIEDVCVGGMKAENVQAVEVNAETISSGKKKREGD